MNKSITLRLQVCLSLGEDRLLGPKTADLLDAIVATGSVKASGRALGMSYKRALQVVEELNKNFVAPLVYASKGGGRRGGSNLTETGRSVLAIYRAIELKANNSGAIELRRVQKLVRKTEDQ